MRIHIDTDYLVYALSMAGREWHHPLSENLATKAAECFRRLGSPRRRTADIATGVTASAFDARLLTRIGRNFAGIPGLEIEESGAYHATSCICRHGSTLPWRLFCPSSPPKITLG